MPAGNRLLWAISFHHLCNDGTLMALIALLPILRVDMGISLYEVGLLGFGLVITVVVQYGVGKVADRGASKLLLETGALLMAASFLLLLLVNDFPGLFSAVIVMRIGGAFYHPVGTSWITRAYGGERLETALGVQSGVGNLGVIIALISSGFLGEYYSWKEPCILWAGLNLLAVGVGASIIKDTGVKASQLAHGEKIRSRLTLQKIGLLFVPIMTGGALYQVTSTFGPLNLTENGGWSPSAADATLALWIAVGTVTSYYFGAICARFGQRRLLKSAYIVSSVCVLLLAFVSQWYIVVVVLVVYGALLFITYPALFAYVTESTDEKERGTAFGILFGLQLGGGATTVYACGAIAEELNNPAYSFAVVSVLAAISAIALFFWERSRDIKGKCEPTSAGSPGVGAPQH